MKHPFVQSLTGMACLLLPVLACAQGAPKAVSPATTIDLTRPRFDTATPHYDVADAFGKATNTVVADVGGRAITLGEVGDAMRALPATVQSLPFDSVYPAVLKQLIQLQAIVVRAEHKGLDKDPVVMRRVKAAADRALSNELLLREAGGTITEKMLLDRYDRDYAGKTGPIEAHVRVILVADEAEASAIIAELAGGADFGAVAQRSSRDTSAPQGGDLGFVRRETLTPETGAIAFAMAPGQSAPYPVKTATGWFVLRVEARRVGVVPPFATIKDEIHTTLLRDGIAAVAQASLGEVTVRSFDISGKDVKAAVERLP